MTTANTVKANGYEVRFLPLAWKKINAYIKYCNVEISGLGRATMDRENKLILVSDVYIWPQECTGSTTEVIDHESVFDLAATLVAQGIPMEELSVWWHSHAHMQAFFSGTDDATMKEWVNNRFLVAVVGNKAGSYKANLVIKEPALLGELYQEFGVEIPDNLSIIEDVPVMYEEDEPDAVIKAVIDEIAEKVTIKAPRPVTPTYQGGGGSTGQSFLPFYDITTKDWATAHVDAVVIGCACKGCNKLRKKHGVEPVSGSKKPLTPKLFDKDVTSTVDHHSTSSDDMPGAWNPALGDGGVDLSDLDYEYAYSCGCSDCEQLLDSYPTAGMKFDYQSHFYNHQKGGYINKNPQKNAK